ncbi:MAG: hypothetical protein US76_03010 [Parcubacteria group bacterium GW2011_GWA2_38_13b]|nr:MAG: hypothetical protein US76_03010 [Parcubacteria group bacterium GW2011_GWA2_38_13b]
MFNFFQNIFDKVISLVASVIIAVGLVSAPTLEIIDQSLRPEKYGEEIILETKQNELESEKQLEEKIKQAGITEENRKAEEEKIKKQIDAKETQRQEELKKQAELEQELKDVLNDSNLTEIQQKEPQQQPRLILFEDNFGNVYAEEKDFVRNAAEPFNNGFGASYTPLCMQDSDVTKDCQPEIINWVNNRSIEIGKTLNIILDSFDANSDSVFYYISYGSRKDWGYGTMRILQSWKANNVSSIPITEQLYEETLFDNLSWGSHYFDSSTRQHYDKKVKLNNAGELNINLCFNEKPERMERGEQFPDGCILFKYFILKPAYSNLTTSTQPQ